ncbi:ABC transporter ATP-binding protein [Lacisediminihabitans changchengi]|uniref:ABC-type quaternary amine transporter n=1 Tax=Lacisediminihabitans changchengi TaxID=2787634 RepID=A0A934VZ71_9MICO|nr:ABC transporter ATP-binding protein [Lacisediminihabitans changchengi]MBK4348827.1 ABC transporter ATP-binding protein [Lacisediminihabitans changchengi]
MSSSVADNRTTSEQRPTDVAEHAARLELTRLVKRYGEVEAVREVSLTIDPGEFVTLLGPSGSGKSTTLAMIAGFETPTSGTITLGDRDITTLSTHKRNLGMVFQGYALFPHMTVFDNVAFPLALRKISKSDIRERVTEALATVGLGQFADRRPSALSGGQQQRVALARAFVHRPKILLMDEPLSALDKSLRRQMQIELRRLHQTLGTTVLFVTHDQEEALSLSDRIVVMNEGAIAQIGSPTEMYENPQTDFVAGFLGSAQFLEGILREIRTNATSTIQLADGGMMTGRCTTTCGPGTAAKVVLRPEDATLDRPSAPANAVTVRTVAQVYLGDRIRCLATFPDGSEGTYWLDHHERSRVVVGDDVTLYWPCSRTVFVANQNR